MSDLGLAEHAASSQTGVPAVVLLTVIYIFLLVFYLNAERKNTGTAGFRKATALKLVLSALFCVIGCVGWTQSLDLADAGTSLWITSRLLVLIGLFACIPGDFFLQYIKLDNVRYRIGIICFLTAQAFFLAGSAAPDPFAGWIWTLLLTAGCLVAILLVMARQKWELSGEKAVLTTYTIVLAFAAMRALVEAFLQPGAGSVVMAAGMASFFASDIVLGIWNYAKGGRTLQNVNWITYFGGTLLISISLGLPR